MPTQPSHSTFHVSILVLLDTFCILLATATGSFAALVPHFTADTWAHFVGHLGYFAVFMVAWPYTASTNRLYISRRRDDLLTLVFDIAKAVLLALIFVGFVMAFYTHFGAEPRYISFFGLSALAFLVAGRIALQLVLWSARRHGYNERQVLIIGANHRTKQLVSTILAHPHYGYRLVGILEDEPSRCRIIEEFNLPYLGKFDALEEVLVKHIVDEVYICLPVRSRYETIQTMANLCEGVGVSVRMIADLFPLRLATSRFHKLEDIPILALSTVPENQPQILLQRTTDIIVSGLMLLMLSPLFIVTAIAIKLDSRGPIFFKQERVGQNQRRFKMVKFRSMVANAEQLRREVEKYNQADGPLFKSAHDPRMTRVGRFIRKYSIDELPQLFNVLVGHMSLVGPRPPLAKEVAQYSWNQRRRLSVKPGMTGLSQVSGRSELSFKDTVDLDLYYIDQWSLGLVFRILFLTVPAVIKGRGAL
ncbi:MAG: sugar transferase [Candidatus Hydrogenedentes bacterium]|nr:sugar transferase [Candidatus Hydrogenedentota bacterium]